MFSVFITFITFEQIIFQWMPEIIVNMNIIVTYMDISIKSVHQCFLSSYKLCLINCLFAPLTDLDLLPAACLLFHLAYNIFVLNGKRLHLVFLLSRWFIMLIFFRNSLGALALQGQQMLAHLLSLQCQSSGLFHFLTCLL